MTLDAATVHSLVQRTCQAKLRNNLASHRVTGQYNKLWKVSQSLYFGSIENAISSAKSYEGRNVYVFSISDFHSFLKDGITLPGNYHIQSWKETDTGKLTGENFLESIFPQAEEYIDKHKQDVVIMTCLSGSIRSYVVTAAYLMVKRKIAIFDVIEQMPCMPLDVGDYLMQLCEFAISRGLANDIPARHSEKLQELEDDEVLYGYDVKMSDIYNTITQQFEESYQAKLEAILAQNQ